MTCIFCEEPIGKSSIEHIVPESLGNLWYTLPSGFVCNTCNGNFSKFEDKAIIPSLVYLWNSTKSGVDVLHREMGTFAGQQGTLRKLWVSHFDIIFLVACS